MTTSIQPELIDQHAKDYAALKEKVLQAKLEVRELEQQLASQEEILQQLVIDHGSAHAQKSKLLHGVKMEVVVTFSQQTKIDSQAVETFRSELAKAKQSSMISRMFEKDIRWNLKQGASEVIRRSTLSQKLQALWGKCIVLKDCKPSLQVREKNA